MVFLTDKINSYNKTRANYHFAFVFVVIVLIGLFLIVAPSILAQENPLDALQSTAETAGLKGETDVTVIIGRIINIVLGFLGLIAVVIIIIGGFMWMTSGGDEPKIKKAKDLILNGVIGLLIIVISYAAARFVVERLQEVGKVAPAP
ncbi:MAG: hypothetical protein AAB465_03115 [Patescibacteria group bacterium]